MTSRDFCYWLQGFFEITNHHDELITASQAAMIKRHLSMVFVHEIDPSFGDNVQQDKLDAAHKPSPPIPSGSILFRC